MLAVRVSRGLVQRAARGKIDAHTTNPDAMRLFLLQLVAAAADTVP